MKRILQIAVIAALTVFFLWLFLRNDNLREVGADAEELQDGLVVRGHDRPLKGKVRSHGDHRIAMAFGILASLPGNEIRIDDREVVAVSFPEFWDQLALCRA